MKYLWLILLIASSPANANCKPVQYEQKEKSVIAHSFSSEPGITIANSLWFPKLIRTGEIIVDYVLSRAADTVIEVATKKLPPRAVNDIISKTYIK